MESSPRQASIHDRRKRDMCLCLCHRHQVQVCPLSACQLRLCSPGLENVSTRGSCHAGGTWSPTRMSVCSLCLTGTEARALLLTEALPPALPAFPLSACSTWPGTRRYPCRSSLSNRTCHFINVLVSNAGSGGNGWCFAVCAPSHPVAQLPHGARFAAFAQPACMPACRLLIAEP